jgi:hypothetical protein
MISLYGGRLLLFCDRADRTWHARVVLGPKPEHQLEADTGAIRLQDAMLRAQSVYQMALANIRPQGEPPMCWDCVQWEITRKRCNLEFPEARLTGGRFAARCELFVPDRP